MHLDKRQWIIILRRSCKIEKDNTVSSRHKGLCVVKKIGKDKGIRYKEAELRKEAKTCERNKDAWNCRWSQKDKAEERERRGKGRKTSAIKRRTCVI